MEPLEIILIQFKCHHGPFKMHLNQFLTHYEGHYGPLHTF